MATPTVKPLIGRSRFHHAGRGLHVHRHDARDALLLHGDADQLLGHFHRDLVVADEQELRFLGPAKLILTNTDKEKE